MKLTLRPEWRLWPLASFIGLLDIKTGVVVVLLFALFNKVAGIYGLIAGATGALQSWAQVTMYIYSVVALYALYRGLNAVQEEDPKQSLYFAHFYFADHIFSTSWTIYFAVVWWLQTPHNGERPEYSPAQQQIIDGAILSEDPLPDDQRAQAALLIWNHEKGFALTIIIISWLFKLYFIALVYSYAQHLRTGSYRKLSRTRHTHAPTTSVASTTYDSALGYGEDEDGDIEDFYRTPVRTPNTGNSVSSFADFVNAPPGRPRRKQSSLSRSALARQDEDDDILFDDDELTFTSSSRGHSKKGTDESSSGSRTDDERNPRS